MLATGLFAKSNNELKANNVKLTGDKSEKGISFEMKTLFNQ